MNTELCQAEHIQSEQWDYNRNRLVLSGGVIGALAAFGVTALAGLAALSLLRSLSPIGRSSHSAVRP